MGLYYYSRLNDEIRQRIQAKFAAHYEHLAVTLRSARLIDGQGIEIRGLSIHDPNVRGAHSELIYFDEIFLNCQTSLQELIQHEPQIARITIRRPRMQATRLLDGSWSVAKLLPLPKFSDRPPDMIIEGAQVAVVDAQRQTPAAFNLKDINLTIVPERNGDPSKGSVCTLNGTLSADHVQHVQIAGTYDKRTEQIEIHGDVAGMDICPELLAILPPSFSAKTPRLSPLRGQAGLSFSVRHARGWTQPQFRVDGRLASARFDAPELPQSLPNIEATFHADNSGIVVDQFTATNRPGRIALSATVGGYEANSPIRIRGEATGLFIGRQWEALLSPNLLEQWRKFLPIGYVNVKDIDLSYDGYRWQTNARVECNGLSFAFYRFPYRLQQGRGTVQLKHNRVDIELTAYAANRPIKIDGTFFNPGPDFTGKVAVRGEYLPIDQTLYQAMCEARPIPYAKACEIIQSLRPIGTFNLETFVERKDPRDLGMHKEMHITLNRCSMCYEKFCYPLSNVEGRIDVVDNVWMFRGFQGTNDSGRVFCDGNLNQAVDGSGTQLQLHFQGDEIALEDELRDAIPNPHVRQLWNDLKPRGSIKLVAADVNFQTGDAQPTIVTKIAPAGESVSIHPSFFPYRLEQMRGQVTFREGRADFADLQAIHNNRTQVSASGFCQHSADGPWHVHFKDFAVDRVRLDQDPDLMMALPAALRKAVGQLQPKGMIALRGTLDLWGDPKQPFDPNSPPDQVHPSNVRSAWTNLEIDMQQATLQTGVALNNVNGNVTLSGAYDPLQPLGQRLNCRGELNVDSVSWNGFQFTGVRGPMWIDEGRVILGSDAEPREPNRLPRRISAQCYGGNVQGNVHLVLGDKPQFLLQSVIAGGDLTRFCTEALPGRQNLQGKVTASIVLNGDARGLNTLNGYGDLKLSEADIYQLPVLVSLLKMLKLRPPDTTAFTESRVKFRVEGDHVLLDHIDFSGEVISLVGEGEMNLDTEINLRLNSVLGRTENQLPFWTALARTASGQIVEFRVTGTLADPLVKREAFPTVTQALQSLQAGMQPAERPLFPQSTRATDGAIEPLRR
ncbi:MAG: hypothetical protein IT427_01160 [Pirellulales bacterium]|nr:hypothetical protein [Pirellulales bacterium]